MANLHVNLIEDERGNLVDILYYCSQICADAAGAPYPSAWPGGMDSDYCQYCEVCASLIEHGLQCEHEDWTIDPEVARGYSATTSRHVLALRHVLPFDNNAP